MRSTIGTCGRSVTIALLTNSIGLQGELASRDCAFAAGQSLTLKKGRLASKPTSNPEAYVLYLQACEKERTALVLQEDSIAVDALYDRAVSLDPQFASSHGASVTVEHRHAHESRSQERKTRRRLWPCKHCAVALDLPEAHIGPGRVVPDDGKKLRCCAQGVRNRCRTQCQMILKSLVI